MADAFQRRGMIRVGMMAVLVAAYAGAGVYTRSILKTDVVYTHFAYLPIVLAGLWWGERSLVVAAGLGVVTLALRGLSEAPGPLVSDLIRALFFLVVAGATGGLSARVARTQRALAASEEKHRLLLDHSLAGVVVVREGRILFVNSRCCELLGYAASELLGRKASELLFEPDLRRDAGPWDGGGEGPAPREQRLTRRDGGIIWVEAAGAVTTYEGRPARLVSLYDVTARKEAEDKRSELAEFARRQEEQLVHAARLAELGEMAASIAHELNQPLTGIRNFAKNAIYMLETNSGPDGEVRHNLQLIADQVDRAARIINQMRGLTRKSDRVFTPLDLNRILCESVDFVSPQLKLDGIKIDLELAEPLPRIQGDRIRLEQVFLNILTNARQAMDGRQERRLGVKTYWDQSSELPVVAEISDTGKGFDPGQSDQLFAPFYTTKKAGEGTGLGLSISQRIIREHRGEIEAIGALGVGSVFKVMLPAAPAAEY